MRELPRTWRRLLSRAARVLGTPDLVTDADEIFRDLAMRRGRRAARAWYRRQAVRAALCAVAGIRPHGDIAATSRRVCVLGGQALKRVLRTPSVSLPFIVVVGLGMGATAFMAQTRRAVMRPDLGLGREVWRVDVYDGAGARLPVTFAWTDPWVREPVGRAGRLMPMQTRTSAVRMEWGALSARVQAVPPGMLRAVGVSPLLGRDAEAPGEAVASHGFWRTYLAADPAAVGSVIGLDGGTATVVGVAPPEFDGVQCCVRMDLWVGADGASEPVRGSAVAVGVTDSALSAAAFAQVLRERDANIGRVVLTAADGAAFGGERGIVGRALFVLLLLAGIAWVGTVSGAVNLLVADVSERAREMRLRAALGSGRSGPLGQLVLEVAWLTGGAAAFAYVTALALFAVAPRVMPLITPDSVFDVAAGSPAWTALSVAVLSTCGICGIAAGAAAMRLAVREGIDRGPRRGHGTTVMLGVQVGLATLLVAASVQFLGDVRALDGGMVGFRRPASVFPFTLATPSARGMQSAEMLEQASRATNASVALTRSIPVYGAPIDSVDAGATRLAVSTEQVTEGYFETLGLRIVAGRPARAASEIVASADLAARLGSSEGALIDATWTLGDEAVRVVGVAEAATWGTGSARPTVYRGWPDRPVRFGYLLASRTSRNGTSLSELAAGLRTAPYAVSSLGTMADLLTRSRLLSVFLARMAVLFSGLCLVVALFGVHAQVLRWVHARERELGIRQALGARPGPLRLFVACAFAVPVGAGILAGAASGIIALRVLRAVQAGLAIAPWLAVAQATLIVVCAAGTAVLLPVLRVRGTSGSELLRDM